MSNFFVKSVVVGLSLMALCTYVLYLNPLFVKTTNISHFDMSELNQKIKSTTEFFLEKGTDYIRTETITSDLKTVEILQRRVGIKSAAELTETKIPTLFLKTSFYPKEKVSSVSIVQIEPALVLEIDSYGDISYLKYSSKDAILPKDILSLVQSLFSILSLKPENLEQIAPEDLANDDLEEVRSSEEEARLSSERKIYREVFFKQRIEGVPLAFYIHKFSIMENDTIYQRRLAFKKSFVGEVDSPVKTITIFLIWFLIGFLSLILLFIKIKRDEIDWVLFFKASLLASLLSFLMLIFKEPFSITKTIIILSISFAIGSFFALIIALSESGTREIYPEHLSVFDALFQGHFRIKEFGKMILWCFIYGNFLFLIQMILFLLPEFKKDVVSVVLPPNPLELKTSFPLSLLLGNLILPSTFGVFSFLLFGILAPVLSLRIGKKWINIFTVFVFALIACLHSNYGPFIICLFLFVCSTPIFYKLWKDFGFLGVFFSILIPLTIQRGLMLFLAKDVSFAVEGLLILLCLSSLLIFSIFTAIKGKPVSKIKTYEPQYLKRIREKERFERELEIAKHLQQKLLPHFAPTLSKIEFGMLCEPALSVGGDYFDFFEPCKDKLFVFLGDVSGKGMKAAFYMTLAKGLLHGSFNLVKDHKELLTILNKRFGTLSEEGVFLTMIMLTIDCKTREILVTSAGHNPPLLFKNGDICLVPSKGLVVGPFPEDIMLKSLEEYKFILEKNDVLLLYTDGVTEAMNPFLEEYGMDRLRSVFSNLIELPAQEIVYNIRKSVLDFTAGSPLSDDLTILVLKGIDEGDR